MENADKDLIDAICQCVFDLLQGNIELSNIEKNKLHKYRNSLRHLVEKSNLNTKKKL